MIVLRRSSSASGTHRRMRGGLSLLATVTAWCLKQPAAVYAATTCNACWGRGLGAELPAGQDPEYRPGSDSSDRACPPEKPFVSGSTDACGCMDPYHGKVCNEQTCCREQYECYGNCGDYTDLYIFLAVVAIALVGFGVRIICRRRRDEHTKAGLQATAAQEARQPIKSETTSP